MTSGERNLIPAKLCRVHALSAHEPVPVENSSDAFYVIDDQLRRWVQKDVSANDLLAEALGTLLAYLLSVPTAEGGYRVDESKQTWWLSRLIEPAHHWRPEYADRLIDPAALGRLLALDAVIGNTDRHRGNIILQPTSSPLYLHVYSIDVAQSWIGTPHDIEHAGLDAPPVHNVARGLPVALIREGALACAADAATLPEDALFDSVREACMIAEEPQEERLRNALRQRLRSAEFIVAKYLKMLEQL